MLATKKLADFPGPRNRGSPKGYLFAEDGAGRALDTIDKLNSWLDERALTTSEDKLDFQLADCVFCHMDLSRRNIILRIIAFICWTGNSVVSTQGRSRGTPYFSLGKRQTVTTQMPFRRRLISSMKKQGLRLVTNG